MSRSASQLPARRHVGEVVRDGWPAGFSGMSRSIEVPMTQIGTMNISNFTQYYSMNRRIHMLGEDGVTKEDFDLDVGTMIRRRTASRMSRARVFLGNFFITITPGVVCTSIRQSTTKLLYMQLIATWHADRSRRRCSRCSMYRMLAKIEGVTVIEKWITWQKTIRALGLRRLAAHAGDAATTVGAGGSVPNPRGTVG